MRSRGSLAAGDTSVLCAAALLSAIIPFSFNYAPRRNDNVAVVFAPWIDAREAIVQALGAGASLVRSARLPFVVVVRPSSPEFFAKVRRNGALLVLDASLFRGCGLDRT